MKDLQIEYIDINRLEPYERNSRKHDRRDIESIKASITEFGFSDPIGIWSDHNVIVEGHGRLEAAKENKVELPKYSYPDQVVSAAMVNRYSKYGVDFSVPVAESYPGSALDAQKEAGKTIFGKGYLLSERAAAERAAATKWSLSEREWGVVKCLGQ